MPRRLRDWVCPAPLRGWISSAASAATDLIYPPQCAACGEELVEPGQALCERCSDLPVASPNCWRCGELAAEGMCDLSGCPRCRHKKLAFHGVVSLGPYEGVLRSSILQLKQAGQEPLAFAMADLLWERAGEALRAFAPHAIVPIPLHWRRRLVRGCNDAELVAERLADHLGVPMARALRRKRNTLPQSELTPPMRKRNLRGALALRGSHRFHHARVVLVDDILTTGETCNEAARVLRRGGVDELLVAVLGRAEGVA